MNAEAQTGARGLGIDLLEELRGGNALVAADADADDAAGGASGYAAMNASRPDVAWLARSCDGLGENLFGLLGAEVAHRVEDPIERGAEVFFRAPASALHALKERIELLAAPEDDADADEDLGVHGSPRRRAFPPAGR